MSYMTLLNRNLKTLAKNAGAVLYLDARKSTGYDLPSNSPLTNPWTDLSGLANNATPTNMAGTTASGVDVSDPLKPFWALDGTDDFFSLVNTASLDITSAPLAVFSTFKIAVGAGNGWLFCKNLDALANVQYGFWYVTTGSYTSAYLESTQRAYGANNSIVPGTWCNSGFIWDGTNVKAYVNCIISGESIACSGALTSRANVRIGCRANNLIFLKGGIASVSVYAGAKATETNVLKAEKSISKTYIGG